MHLIMLNVIMNMLWGGTFNDEDKIRIGLEFGRVAEEVVEYVGKTNISDFFPVLARLDLQGVERRMKELVSWLDSFFSSIIEQRMKNYGDQDGKNEFKDILQIFLQLQDQGESRTPFTITNLKALFTDLVVVGTDTSGVTVEWVMAELLKHPKIMKNAQEELDNVVGRNNNVEESHISRLPYLGAILKETLRLNPVGPLLASRCPSSSCNVGGYVIPKGAQVFVNAWAIQRDPKYWDNPYEFQPERRRCVGIPLAERMVPYALASLLRLFEWRMPEGEEIDLSDKFGNVLKKNTPLHAIPFPRLSDPSLYV
ncbi:7-ethoxycoumarin O-deethylase-like [Papaver somniferum]|uniref:7-ethoxycoumarin O-deethylase-like n=1 Tax=Papaver somniferum TaxID=3469 RepID=UPI000E7050D2|nr:7-ethoxycoumarin O-deethylase-like [Papaver somniferum]